MPRRGLLFVVVVVAAVAAAAVRGNLKTSRPRPASPKPIPSVTLTAIMAQGIWTDEDVTAVNSWRRDFRVARLVLRRGETAAVVLRAVSPAGQGAA